MCVCVCVCVCVYVKEEVGVTKKVIPKLFLARSKRLPGDSLMMRYRSRKKSPTASSRATVPAATPTGSLRSTSAWEALCS